MAFNWNDYPAEDKDSPGKTVQFNWDALPMEEPKPSQYSEFESGVRGAAQGASFGFADEATGALEAARDWLSRDPAGFMDNYKKHRDESRANYKAAEEANPGSFLTGQFGGAAAPTLLTGGAGGIASLAAQGAAQGLGSSEADLAQGDIGGAARDAAIGGTIGGALGAATKAIAPAIGKVSNYLSNAASGRLANTAEDLAVKATGATGRQAEKFAPNAGRELLDRGIVRFGRTPEDVAMRASEASDEAGNAISQALSDLDAKGVTASLENIRKSIEGKVRQLTEVPGNERIIKQLNSELDNLYARGQSDLPISVAENAKRAFQGQTNYASPEAEKKASAQLARAFKEEVESSALQANPEIADKFLEGKKTFGLLAPIQEAAEKRASQLNQSPFGGFGDFAAGAAGSLGGGGGIAGTVAARRLAAPRLASSGAVIADNLSEIIAKAPQMLGKFAKPLQAAANRGPQAVASTNFILQQTNPEYRRLIFDSEEDNE